MLGKDLLPKSKENWEGLKVTVFWDIDATETELQAVTKYAFTIETLHQYTRSGESYLIDLETLKDYMGVNKDGILNRTGRLTVIPTNGGMYTAQLSPEAANAGFYNQDGNPLILVNDTDYSESLDYHNMEWKVYISQ